MSMPRWLVLVLRWGGVALVVVAAAGLIYVQLVAPTLAEVPAETTAPLILYWVLLVVGVVAAAVGFFVAAGTPESEA